MLLRICIIAWLFFDIPACKTVPDKLIYPDLRIISYAKFPNPIDESSGMEWISDTSLCTHNDGNQAILFRLDKNLSIKQTDTLPQAFWDWEELSTDYNTHIFLGDIGDNANKRKWLYIYKYNHRTGQTTDTIRFYYQKKNYYIPKLYQKNFDSEAFFYFQDSLYLFSKNRGYPYTYLYTIPARTGRYSLNQSAILPVPFQVTSAAIHPHRKEFTLLTYKGLFIFRFDDSPSHPKLSKSYRWKNLGICEAICYDHHGHLWLSNEEGYVYQIFK